MSWDGGLGCLSAIKRLDTGLTAAIRMTRQPRVNLKRLLELRTATHVQQCDIAFDILAAASSRRKEGFEGGENRRRGAGRKGRRNGISWRGDTDLIALWCFMRTKIVTSESSRENW
jgi:hypothetical protein